MPDGSGVIEQAVTCDACPLRKSARYREFSQDELEFIKSFKVGELATEAGSTILVDGHDSAHLYTVLDGWAMRAKY